MEFHFIQNEVRNTHKKSPQDVDDDHIYICTYTSIYFEDEFCEFLLEKN